MEGELHSTTQPCHADDIEATVRPRQRPEAHPHEGLQQTADLDRDLDVAVFAADGWGPAITDNELLERLLELNPRYAAEEDERIIAPP